MADTVYCYSDSDVLMNKLGIREREKLHTYEKRLTMLRLLEIMEEPVKGSFDFKHLKMIHAYIFQDLYDWAGKVRSVDIAKGNMFCNVRFIEPCAQDIFGQLKADKYLKGLSRADFIKKLAYYFSEINALHPFREGNGRSQREFIRALALKNGYVVRFAGVSEEEMIEASKASFLCDYRAMEAIFEACVSER